MAGPHSLAFQGSGAPSDATCPAHTPVPAVYSIHPLCSLNGEPFGATSGHRLEVSIRSGPMETWDWAWAVEGVLIRGHAARLPKRGGCRLVNAFIQLTKGLAFIGY